MTSRVNVAEYLRDNDIRESLVIRLGYSRVGRRVELVIDFARSDQLLAYLESGIRPAEPPIRDFRRLMFGGVWPGSIKGAIIRDSDVEEDVSLHSRPPVVIQDVDLNSSATATVVSLYFDSSNELEFKFTTLDVSRRLVSVEKDGDKPLVRDRQTNNLFDFWNPFPDA